MSSGNVGDMALGEPLILWGNAKVGGKGLRPNAKTYTSISL